MHATIFVARAFDFCCFLLVLVLCFY